MYYVTSGSYIRVYQVYIDITLAAGGCHVCSRGEFISLYVAGFDFHKVASFIYHEHYHIAGIESEGGVDRVLTLLE